MEGETLTNMNNQKGKRNSTYKFNSGITLIALIITIVVLLILAVVTINAVQDGGIIQYAKNSTSKYREGQIIEKIKLAVSEAKLRGLGTLEIPALEEELTEQFGANNYNVVLIGEDYVVVVENVQYKISTGESNTTENTGIKYAGDPTKNKQYNGKTLETAFKITCIEDLVEWSNNYSKYYGYIELEKTLDFKDTSSYNDFNAKTTDINGNGKIEALITELTTGTGFVPITNFYGSFNGNGEEIRNIYINRTTGNAGLIATIPDTRSLTIEDLGIIGEIKTAGSIAGAFLGKAGSGSTVTIKKCYNKCKVLSNGTGSLGGFVGATENCTLTIESCHNEGEIFAGKCCGGFVGNAYLGSINILNCYNLSNIRS